MLDISRNLWFCARFIGGVNWKLISSTLNKNTDNLRGYYITQLVGPNFKCRRGPKLDERVTYHKWRIYLEVGKLGWRILPTGSFWLPNSYFTSSTDEVGLYTIIQFEGSNFVSWTGEIAGREPKTAGCEITSSQLPHFQIRHLW